VNQLEQVMLQLAMKEEALVALEAEVKLGQDLAEEQQLKLQV
jgi:hypothetical protein